jgi:hypothetical protein
MHATVNTNASSALNTQKSINSYDGGVQPLVLSSAIITQSGGTGAAAMVWTAAIPATASPLDEVSDIVFDLTGLENETKQTVLKSNTQGLTLKITGSISSTAPASVNTAALKLARFQKLFDVKNNVWECVDIKYAEGSDSTLNVQAQVLGQYPQEGSDRFNRGSMTLITPLVQDALTFQIQKVLPEQAVDQTGKGGEQRISHITLRRRRRGLALPS